jgi:hypothetical protein
MVSQATGLQKTCVNLAMKKPAAADFSTEVDVTLVVVPPLSSRTEVTESYLLLCSSNSKTSGRSPKPVMVGDGK